MPELSTIERLTNRAEDIRFRTVEDGNILISSYRWDTKKDLRITSIKRLARLLIALNVSFIYLSRADQESILEGIRFAFEDNIDLREYLLINELFLKSGFISSLFFIIESVLRDYLRFLDGAEYKNRASIMSICRRLLIEKQISNTLVLDCETFNFLRLLRNTLHNNGVHLPPSNRDKNRTVTFKGREYQFQHGSKIDFATWDLLLDIADDMRNLLFHLANSDVIRSIPGLIPDLHTP